MAVPTAVPTPAPAPPLLQAANFLAKGKQLLPLAAQAVQAACHPRRPQLPRRGCSLQGQGSCQPMQHQRRRPAWNMQQRLQNKRKQRLQT